jgi:hypothetical protein
MSNVFLLLSISAISWFSNRRSVIAQAETTICGQTNLMATIQSKTRQPYHPKEDLWKEVILLPAYICKTYVN